MTEFHVSSSDSVRRVGASFLITGMVNRGIIRLGLVFSKITKWPPVLGGEELLGDPVQLTVTKIVSYGKELDEVDLGMTAELCLDGVGGERLERGVMLHAADRLIPTGSAELITEEN